MVRVFIETYGCTLNQADSDILKALVQERHEIVLNEDECELIILNTCTVKGTTENKIFSRLETLSKKFVVCGCMDAERIRKFAPNAPIVGTSSLNSINDAIDDALAGKSTIYKKPESKDYLPKLLSAPIMRIPINDGCLSSCNFCQTKLSRPYLRSYFPKTIVNWINKSVGAGAREIQLTSMDSGAYGRDIKTNLIELLDLILDDNSSTKSEEEYLIRLGMLNPNHAKEMLPELIRIFKNRKFYKFLHVPVQAGSEKVVKEMNRDHSVADFVEIANAFRREIPEFVISTDIIVGYPTETEDDFEKTLDLLRNVRPDIINISRFSPRPGTKAQKLKQLPTQELKRRSRETTLLSSEIRSQSRRNLIGKEYTILITESYPDFRGRNVNYQQVVVKEFGGKLGERAKVKIIDADQNSLFGEIII
ncbi:tRNA (N(6)-L-threonylcarbamoyladenosine(37)-C(2))-methylthiotransferase [Candidatus Micrarchaeota archaeon]|nr:tRNA (N(6)-L-threonylcarbamoyladenosine(37)-C(2))-methylthiotransferase [Candidatus Micrarchaeota archaeon]MBU1681269.1 tRNA (N(6)-L-threonylcarbamoyladenosine(37)-C(2))-methylthiotransferase [Candidatus Micrarchaeota archaeon]